MHMHAHAHAHAQRNTVGPDKAENPALGDATDGREGLQQARHAGESASRGLESEPATGTQNRPGAAGAGGVGANVVETYSLPAMRVVGPGAQHTAWRLCLLTPGVAKRLELRSSQHEKNARDRAR